mmetsp:Transcript_15965/g.16093  ORF Transcript_15965/g.16093 Transcript_15965/m.16093 type:complete len:224 (-) Transcript_15965:37-708(-)
MASNIKLIYGIAIGDVMVYSLSIVLVITLIITGCVYRRVIRKWKICNICRDNDYDEYEKYMKNRKKLEIETNKKEKADDSEHIRLTVDSTHSTGSSSHIPLTQNTYITRNSIDPNNSNGSIKQSTSNNNFLSNNDGSLISSNASLNMSSNLFSETPANLTNSPSAVQPAPFNSTYATLPPIGAPGPVDLNGNLTSTAPVSTTAAAPERKSFMDDDEAELTLTV